MTQRTFYVQSTKYQLHLLLRTTLHKYSELADTSSPCMLILAVSRLILSVGMIQIVLFQIAMSA